MRKDGPSALLGKIISLKPRTVPQQQALIGSCFCACKSHFRFQLEFFKLILFFSVSGLKNNVILLLSGLKEKELGKCQYIINKLGKKNWKIILPHSNDTWTLHMAVVDAKIFLSGLLCLENTLGVLQLAQLHEVKIFRPHYLFFPNQTFCCI